MMATLLEFRGLINRFYARYDVYVKPVLKFILALILLGFILLLPTLFLDLPGF